MRVSLSPRPRRCLPAWLLGALGLALAAGSSAGCRGQISRRTPIHLIDDMDQQARLDPQEPSDVFADGRALRLPEHGTVRTGWLLDDDTLTEQYLTGSVQGEWTDWLPAVDGLELNRALLDRGRDRFDIYCAPCHGLAGQGDGMVVARGMIPPPSFHEERLRSVELGYFVHVIAEGVRNMPAYGAQVSPRDRWAIATYVRALQATTRAGTDQGPAPTPSPERLNGE